MPFHEHPGTSLRRRGPARTGLKGAKQQVGSLAYSLRIRVGRNTRAAVLRAPLVLSWPPQSTDAFQLMQRSF